MSFIFKKVLISSFLLNFFVIIVFAQNNIELKFKELSKIKKEIEVKKRKKNEFLSQEQKITKELRFFNNNISCIEKKLKKCLYDTNLVQNDLKKSLEMYSSFSFKKDHLKEIIYNEIKSFNKMTFIYTYEQNPFEYKIRHILLAYKKDNFENIKKEIVAYAINIKKLEKLKKKLSDLQHYENKLITQYKQISKEKSAFLKTVSTKIFMTENEIKILNENAKALQLLINKINLENKQKHLNDLTRTISNKNRKLFPWPTAGKVISNFGKNKHPELNTYIINNGIKISGIDFANVKSIDSGTVVFTGEFRSYGKVIIIDHSNSLFSVYGFLNRILVTKNQKVVQNDIIANLGSGKRSILYFEIRQNNIPNDPIPLLQ
ncbi:MAG: peptidoglycan DD-metalloendopeptidase family protein [Endomicrobium sp.]|jgi:septal ring factor EnvC (AmiA/AmiB activator)|nr:peptidoglycan DD-metalloendopeptidase family protein [Endomicrobium sp.]